MSFIYENRVNLVYALKGPLWQTNKLIEKEMRSDLVTRGGGGGELDENNEKILQISSYKIGIQCTS